jgi:hypothetical protein
MLSPWPQADDGHGQIKWERTIHSGLLIPTGTSAGGIKLESYCIEKGEILQGLPILS